MSLSVIEKKVHKVALRFLWEELTIPHFYVLCELSE